MPSWPDMSSNLDAAKRYLAAIAGGATGDQLAAFFDPDVVQQEFPNQLTPDGATRGLTEILEGAERGQKVLRSQRYGGLGAVTRGAHVGVGRARRAAGGGGGGGGGWWGALFSPIPAGRVTAGRGDAGEIRRIPGLSG